MTVEYMAAEPVASPVLPKVPSRRAEGTPFVAAHGDAPDLHVGETVQAR